MSNISNSHRRYSIGVIIRRFEEIYQSNIWDGISDFAKKNDINLVSIVASSINISSTLDYSLHYDLITKIGLNDKIDGFILLSAAMWENFSYDKIYYLRNSLKPAPMVSLGVEIEDAVSVLTDNYTGMYDAVSHLIEVHGYNRIAFITGTKGHAEAEERLKAYRDALENHNLKIDEDLVVQGNFIIESGIEAVKVLLDERKVQIDAIAAVNDVTAIGALIELQKRGIYVPDNISIVGFDDIKEASYSFPPLTTVKQDVYNMGWKSIESLLAVLKGDNIPNNKLYIPTKLIIRDSCGCSQKANMKILEKVMNKDCILRNVKITENDFGKWARVISCKFDENKLDKKNAEKMIFEMLLALDSDLGNKDTGNYSFIRLLDKTLYDFFKTDDDSYIWNDILSEIREFYFEFYDNDTIYKFEFIFQRARISICEAVKQYHDKKEMQLRFLASTLRSVSHSLMITFDFDILLKYIEESLKDLGIRSCFIAYFDENRGKTDNKSKLIENSKLIFAYHEKRIEISGDKSYFNRKSILPEIEETVDINNLILMPLHFYNEEIGFILYEYCESQTKDVYEILRGHISIALKGAFMFERQKRMETELKLALKKLESVNTELSCMSLLDELTSTYNRRGFFEFASKYYDVPGSYVLLFMDLDGLKQINDTFGHKEGDFAIKNTADIFRKTFRPSDLISRIGGDEFVILIKDIKKNEDLNNIKNSVKENFDKFNNSSTKPYELSVSIGAFSFAKFSEKSLEEIMTKADNILYEEKKLKKLNIPGKYTKS